MAPKPGNYFYTFLILLLCGCSSTTFLVADSGVIKTNLPIATKISLPAETIISLPIIFKSSPSGDGQNVPITIVSFENYQLKFTCISPGECPSNFTLDQDQFINKPIVKGPIFYAGPQSIFAIFESTSSWDVSVVHIDTETGRINYLKLPIQSDSLISTVVEGRFVFSQYNQKQVYILDENLDMQVVNIGIPVTELVTTGEKSVIAHNGHPPRTDTSFRIEFAAVDVLTGKVIQETSKQVELGLGPDEKKFVEVEGVSPDLEEFYCLYTTSDKSNPLRLGEFETNSGSERRAIPIPPIFVTTGFSQYHNSLYTSNLGDGYGGPASLYDLVRLESAINNENIPENYSGKLIVMPFGNSFLFGMFMKVVQVTLQGEVLGEYDLPKEWINETYYLLYYQR